MKRTLLTVFLALTLQLSPNLASTSVDYVTGSGELSAQTRYMSITVTNYSSFTNGFVIRDLNCNNVVAEFRLAAWEKTSLNVCRSPAGKGSIAWSKNGGQWTASRLLSDGEVVLMQ